MPSSTPYFSIAASVSPPPAIENAGLAAIACGERARAFAELVELEHADRAVPDDRAGRLRRCWPRTLGGVRADVEDHLVGARRRRPLRTSACAVAANSLRDHHVGRHRHLDAARLRLREQVAAPRRPGRPRAATCRRLTPVAARKVLAMPPPTISWSTLREQALEDRELGRDLGAADDRDQRPLRLLERRSSASSSAASSGPAQATGANSRDAVRGRLGAVRGAEGVHDEDVAQRRHLLRELFVVLLLALVEAHVLEQHDLAGRRSRRRRASPSSKRTVPAEQLARALARPARARTPARTRPPSGRPRCDITITRAPASSAAWMRRQRRADARVARDLAVLRPGTFRSSRISTRLPRRSRSAMRRTPSSAPVSSRAFDQASVVSSMRFEKPHSLSYQAQTFTSVPSMTLRQRRVEGRRTPGRG